MPNIWQTPISSTPDSKPDRYSGRGDVDIAMVRSSRLAGALLRSRRAGRNGINPGGQLLRAAATSGVGAAGVVVRAGVDGVVRNDGGVGVVGVAPWGMGWCARGADTVRRAAGAQRAVELVVLCVASGRVGVRRHRGAVARAGVHHRSVCEEANSGGMVVGAVSGMGELCGGAQFLGMATQSSSARLIPCCHAGSWLDLLCLVARNSGRRSPVRCDDNPQWEAACRQQQGDRAFKGYDGL